MSINKKISEFISVDGFDNTTQIPIVQGSPMFNAKITPEKFAEALGLIPSDLDDKIDKIEGDLDNKVDKVEGKSLILDTEIERLANVTNQTRESLNIDKVDNTSDLDKPISTATKTYVDNKVKTDVPVDAKFTDTIVDISGKADKTYVDEEIAILEARPLPNPMVTLTQAEYNNLSPKDPDTFYFIKEE